MSPASSRRALILLVALVLTWTPPAVSSGALAAPAVTGFGVASTGPSTGTKASASASNSFDGPGDARPASNAAVTLLTGDRVLLRPGPRGEPTVLVEARDGGATGGFTVEDRPDGTHVVPNDVAHLVPDVLDPDLFNVTRLVEMGYDDASTDALPLIVERAAGARRLAADALPLDPQDQLSSIGATAATVAKSDAAELGELLASLHSSGARATARALGGGTRIYLDGKVEGTALDGYLDQVNAPAAWDTGLDGSGVTVAVLDSGIDDGHPALAGQVVAEQNFTDEADADDHVGHGTHVASILAGNGAGAEGARQGVAPGADLVSGRVLDSDNQGLESWVIAGMEWAVDQDVDLVNMSLGGPPAEHDDPVVQSLEELTERSDTLFVVAAGNRGGFGNDLYSINSPGTAPSALTVGAARADDGQARFSSEGPTTGSHLVKPDVLAPGVQILGARAGAREGDLYTPLSGTSMATPVVAGAAALLTQAHPDWTAEQVRARIMTTADGNLWYRAWTHGSGRLDLGAALHRPLVSDTGTLDAGYLRHPNDAVQRRAVTLTNTGAEPVTVSVHDAMTSSRYVDGDWEAAPEDAVTAEPATLSIPAGASATTTVSLDPHRLTDSLWQGVVTFDAGDETLLRIPIGAYDEPESYDLDVQVRDRNGDPYDPAHAEGNRHATSYVYAMNADAGDKYRIDLDADGRGHARVRAGHYSLFAHVATPATGTEPGTTTYAGTAEVLIDSDTDYVIDAREGDRLDELTVAGQSTRATTAIGFTYRRAAKDRGTGYTVLDALDPQEVRDGRIFVTPTSPVSTGLFESTLRWQLEPTGKVRPQAPDAYDVLWNEPHLPADLSARLSRKDVKELARVEQVLHPAATSGGHALVTAGVTEHTLSGFAFARPVDLPSRRTVLATARPDVRWQHCLELEWNWWRGFCRSSAAFTPRSRVEIEIGSAVHAAAVETARSPGMLRAEAGWSDGNRRMKVVNPDALESSRMTLATPAGAVLGSADGTAGFFPVAEDQQEFRLTHEWQLRPGLLRAATGSKTVWNFRAVPGEVPMLLDPEYGPVVDAMGTAAPRRPLRLDLSFESGELTQEVRPARITDAGLWWSTDDGTTWTRTHLRRTSATSFTAKVSGRELRPGDHLSLRVTAADERGNTVDQSSIGLVPVRDR